MKTKISFLTMMVAMTAFMVAQAGPSASGGNAAVPSQSANHGNHGMMGVPTNGNMNVNGWNTNSNWPGGNNGMNAATNGNGMGGIMPTNRFNPYAGYTNPNSTYINPNTTNVNPYATYTNPYAMVASNNPFLNGVGGRTNPAGLTNSSGFSTNNF